MPWVLLMNLKKLLVMYPRIRKKTVDGKTYLSPIITGSEINGQIVYTKHVREFKEALREESLSKEDSL